MLAEVGVGCEAGRGARMPVPEGKQPIPPHPLPSVSSTLLVPIVKIRLLKKILP